MGEKIKIMHYCPCEDLISVYKSVPFSKKVPADLQSAQRGIIIHFCLKKTSDSTRNYFNIIKKKKILLSLIVQDLSTASYDIYTLRSWYRLNPDYCVVSFTVNGHRQWGMSGDGWQYSK